MRSGQAAARQSSRIGMRIASSCYCQSRAADGDTAIIALCIRYGVFAKCGSGSAHHDLARTMALRRAGDGGELGLRQFVVDDTGDAVGALDDGEHLRIGLNERSLIADAK
jgi:hypothetical protein